MQFPAGKGVSLAGSRLLQTPGAFFSGDSHRAGSCNNRGQWHVARIRSPALLVMRCQLMLGRRTSAARLKSFLFIPLGACTVTNRKVLSLLDPGYCPL